VESRANVPECEIRGTDVLFLNYYKLLLYKLFI
jgi:hypothetical protein